MRDDPILYFRGSYTFLSNFFIEPDGTHVEGEYQRAKCEDEKYGHVLFDGKPPVQCKAIGRGVKLREGWDSIRIEVMSMYVLQKFSDHPELCRRLLETGDRCLVEGNHWRDNFWGSTKPELWAHSWSLPTPPLDIPKSLGENWLGRVLMGVRYELRSGVLS